jgi:hypothetical protein
VTRKFAGDIAFFRAPLQYRKNLPKETQGYVPAFATMYLYEYRKEHGIVPDRR